MTDELERELRARKRPKEDAEEIREVFGALTDSIPKMVSGILGSVYSPEAAASIAGAIGSFYNKLIEQGIPRELALEMTKGYVGALDFAKLMGMVGEESRTSKRIRMQADRRADEKNHDEEE